MTSFTPPFSGDSKRTVNWSAPGLSSRSPLNAITVLWLGKSPPIRPDCATNTPSGDSLSSTKVLVPLAVVESALTFRSSVRTTEPPSVSNATRMVSVTTVMSSRGAACVEPGAAEPGGTAAAPGAAADAGSAEGRLAPACGAAAVAAGLDCGKKVACRPLCTCHWSQRRTREKPKTTQRMVRRMSFMKSSWTKPWG